MLESRPKKISIKPIPAILKRFVPTKQKAKNSKSKTLQRKENSIKSSLEMADPNSQDDRTLGDDQHGDSQTNFSTAVTPPGVINPSTVVNPSAVVNPPTVVHPAQGQSRLDRYLTTSYPIQESVLSNLNRLDFRNLQLAGIRTPISRQVQRQHLIPSKCNEKVRIFPATDEVACHNTTQTVDEIKVCHGKFHDGHGIRGRRDRWEEPQVIKHSNPRDARGFWLMPSQSKGGNFDSFNVCIHCHDRDRQRRRVYEDYTIRTFRSPMCREHSLEYGEQRPYDACRCKMFLEKYWLCHRCAPDALDELKLRAKTFGDVSYPTFVWDLALREYRDNRPGPAFKPARHFGCPILGCTARPWLAGPVNKQVFMCRACTSIFPRPREEYRARC